MVQSDEELAMFFAQLGGFESLDAEERSRIGALLKHDGLQAQQYFEQRLRKSGGKLESPLMVIMGNEDELTTGFEKRYKNWEHFAKQVALRSVPGGHYFLHESPQLLSDIIREQCSL